MTPPKFQPSISTGNILQIGALIVCTATAYAVMDTRSKNNAESVKDTREAVQQVDGRMRTDLAELERRVRGLETGLARSDERLTAILELLARIDNRLERIERAN